MNKCPRINSTSDKNNVIKIYRFIFAIVLFVPSSLCCLGQAYFDEVTSIGVYAIEPHMSTFAPVAMEEIVLDKPPYRSEDYDTEPDTYFKSKISSRRRIHKISADIKRLIACKKDSTYNFSAHIVLRLEYKSGMVKYIIMGGAYSQQIYFDGYEYKSNFAFYRKVLSYLPRRWRKPLPKLKSQECAN